MGRVLKIRNANFSSIAIGNTNDDTGDTNWILGTHDYMNQFGPGGQFGSTVLWFGDAFTGGTSFFSGKTFSKFKCRFQEGEASNENYGTTANVHIGYCDVGGENFVELAAIQALYNTVMEFNEPITIPENKTLYIYITNRWIKTVSSEEITILNLQKGVNYKEGGQVYAASNTCLMFDIYEI